MRISPRQSPSPTIWGIRPLGMPARRRSMRRFSRWAASGITPRASGWCRFWKSARGLNLTWEVRDGVGTHSKGLADLQSTDRDTDDSLPATLEGQVVRLADRIAYVHHDTDDAIRAGLVTEREVPAGVRAHLGQTRGEWLDRMVRDLVSASQDQPTIRLSDNVREAQNTLKDFLASRVYRGPAALAEVVKAKRLVQALYEHYLAYPDEISSEYRELMARGDPVGRVVGDFLAGMTDRYAIRLAEALFIPRSWAP